MALQLAAASYRRETLQPTGLRFEPSERRRAARLHCSRDEQRQSNQEEKTIQMEREIQQDETCMEEGERTNSNKD